MMHGRQKSDPAIVAVKPANKAGQTGGGVGGAKGGGRGEHGRATHAPDAEPGERVPATGPCTASSKATEEGAVHRAVAPRRRRSAAGVVLLAQAEGGRRGGWRDMAATTSAGLEDQARAICMGASTAAPTGRYRRGGSTSPKPDGKQRPLGIAALEDKIVQRAVVEVLNAVYEADFLGFSYGFRPGRSQHDALDALAVGITRTNVNYIVDADVEKFFDRSAMTG